MILEKMKANVLPVLPHALLAGRTSPIDLDVRNPLDCQLSMGVHLIDEQTLYDRAMVMRQHIWPDGRGTNFFAVKGQPNHYVLDSLRRKCGFRFDCSSPTEILDAKAVGAGRHEIMYTANATPWSHLKFALDNGAILNLDDIGYLDVLEEVPEIMSFRVNIGKMRGGEGQNKIIGKATEQKYGVPYDKIVVAYKKAQAMGVKEFGLHTMYASNNRDWTVHVTTVDILLRIADMLHRQLGIRLKFINAGGGIGVDYKDETDPSVKYEYDDRPFAIDRYGVEVNQLLSEFELANSWRPDFHLECARYVAAPAGVWVAPIVQVVQKYRRFACMGACDGADLLRAGIYPAHHNVIILDRHFMPVTNRNIIKQSLVGPLCENIHAAADRFLPEIIAGDYAMFCDTACHGIEMGMNYNGWTKSAQVMRTMEGEIVLISRAQTMRDIRSLQIPFAR